MISCCCYLYDGVDTTYHVKRWDNRMLRDLEILKEVLEGLIEPELGAGLLLWWRDLDTLGATSSSMIPKTPSRRRLPRAPVGPGAVPLLCLDPEFFAAPAALYPLRVSTTYYGSLGPRFSGRSEFSENNSNCFTALLSLSQSSRQNSSSIGLVSLL